VVRNVPALAALICCLLFAHGARAQFNADFGDAPFEISADTIDYERERDVYVARGNVQLVQGSQSLSADWVSFSRTGGRGVASGRVVFSDGTETVYANFVEFNLDTLQGVMFLARFDAATERFKMEGDEVAKTGDRTYSFEGGVFTSCRCPDDEKDPWEIRAESATLNLDGYAIARNTTVNILGVPVLWLPWMAYPLRTDRETGFLFPEFSFFSRDGVRFATPFFWAAAPNLNVTLTPRWLEKRGFKGEAELEYLLGERSAGSLVGAYIHDDKIDPNSIDDPFDADRWIARGKQDMYLPYDWRAKSDFLFMSDNRYLSDFEGVRELRNNRFIESNLFLFNQFGDGDRVGFVAAMQVADDIQSPDDLDRDPYLLHRVPNVDLKVLPQPLELGNPVLDRLVPSLDVQYTYFGQLNNPDETFPTFVDPDPLVPPVDPRFSPNGELAFYDIGVDALPDGQEGGPPGTDFHQDNFLNGGGPERDGRFQEGEPLADRGHRMLVSPRLAVPFRVGNYVEVYPEVGYHQALYNTRDEGTANWGSITARANVRSRFKRGYGTDVVHLLEPYLDYALVSRPNIDDEPFFAPLTSVPQGRIRQRLLDNFTRDNSDRPEEFNGFTIGTGNRFYREGRGSRSARMLADFDVGFLFDFSSGGKIGAFVLDGRANPTPGTALKIGFQLDPDGFVVEELLAEAGWRGDRLAGVLRYRFLNRVPQFFEDFRKDSDRFDDFDGRFKKVNQVDLSMSYRLTQNWSVRHRIIYSFENSILLHQGASVEYLSKCECWAAGIAVRNNRQLGFEFGLLYRIVGLGNDPSAGNVGLENAGFFEGF
jgi:lipopolysaccharide export system protein LptA